MLDPVHDLRCGVRLAGETAGKGVAGLVQRIPAIRFIEHELANWDVVRDLRKLWSPCGRCKDHVAGAEIY